jgi:hypothetical protein
LHIGFQSAVANAEGESIGCFLRFLVGKSAFRMYEVKQVEVEIKMEVAVEEDVQMLVIKRVGGKSGAEK